jgi:hypothetical protein
MVDETVVAAPVVPDSSATPEQTPVVAPSALDAVLDGESIEEPIRGKKVSDVLAMRKADQAEITKAKQELAQWRQWAAEQMSRPQTQAATSAGAQGQAQANPLEGVDARLAPLMGGLAGIQKEFVRSNREDFDTMEERATAYFRQMPPLVQIDPNYGWDYAYRMAQAEKLPTVREKLRLPTPAPSAAPVTAPKPSLSPEESRMAKTMGLTEDEWIKFKQGD